jgi:hypothetical protein
MAEPDSSTDETADAPPGGPAPAREHAVAAPHAPSSMSKAHGAAADAAGAIAIDPLAIIETSGEPAVGSSLLEETKPRARSAPSMTERAAKASASIEERIVAQAREPRDSAASKDATRARSSSVTSSTEALASDARPLAAYELLARSARIGDLVALASRIITDAARARSADWAFTSKVVGAAEEAELSRDDADTRFGNVLDVLSTGGEGTAERALASALWAHAVAESPRSRTEDEDRLAGDILWLATHTAFDATPLLDRALGDEASDLWAAVAERVRRIERGKGGALGRGEAVVACAALAASEASTAKALCEDLAGELKDPVLLRVLATSTRPLPNEVRLEGELVSAPRGPMATAVLAFTGILFVLHAARIALRLALAYRRPAEVSLSESGVRVKTRTELLGRTLREHEHVIVRSGLVRVVREVRFPGLAFYAGLLALAVGSYVGVRAFVDGVRSASPSLLVVGLVIVALGIGADFVLGTLVPGSRGRCRVSFVPRTGSTLCIGNVDVDRADDALARSLSRR